jgi:ankyrin repeat protein
MLAAYHGHAPLVKLLIQHGADPNCLNDRRQSPLAGAVFKGEAEVIEVCDHHPEPGREVDGDEIGFA